MADHFREEAVYQHKRGMNEALYYLAIIIMVISGLWGILELTSCLQLLLNGAFTSDYLIGLVIGIVSAAMAVLLWFYRGRLRTEFEYTFTNGDLAFAAVFNNVKRKSLGNLNVKTVDAFGPVQSGAFNRYVSMQGVQQTRWFLNRDGNLYFFFFQKNGNKRLIVFEPTNEMVEDIKFYLPHGAYQEH